MTTKRGPKTSCEQYEIYLEYIRKHDVLITGKLSPGMSPNVIKELWDEMVVQLNNVGTGPSRTVDNWRKAFNEWKSTTKKKAREKKPLKELERQLINVMKPVVIVGVSSITELGAQDILVQEKEINLEGDNVVLELEIAQSDDPTSIMTWEGTPSRTPPPQKNTPSPKGATSNWETVSSEKDTPKKVDKTPSKL
uniref:Regulatory protein zeste n=1 Tax=Photinus pyralis TaxID=7054 RepID=A0A1Y1LJ84_PHOPY